MREAKNNIGALARSTKIYGVVGLVVVIAAAVMIIGVVQGRSSSKAVDAPTGETVMSFTSMAGVDDAFLNNTVVRNVKGDELPWVVGTVNGSLSSDGHLQVNVR